MLVSVSFTKSKYKDSETLKKIDETSADYLHIDLMDGKFVKVTQQTVTDLKKILSKTVKPLDVHIMAKNPIKYLEFFAMHNTEYFTFHYEAVDNVEEMISKIKETGLRVGISINPKTKVKVLLPYLDKADQILIMSVTPGLGGQEFQEKSLEKISFLRDIKEEKGYNYVISVDGGINDATINLVKEAGVNMVVSGSFICMSDSYQEKINELKKEDC